MDGLYGTQMVHRWYAYGMQMVWVVCMVHRWYIDGMHMAQIDRMVRK